MKSKILFFTAATALFSLALAPSALADNGTWSVDASGLWSTDTNWAGSVIADGSGFTANLTTDVTADTTVSLDSDRTITNVVFGDGNATTAGSWIVDNNGTSTNNLILAGTTPTITVNTLGTAKTATISAGIEGTAGLTKAGNGTLVLTGTNAYSGGTTIQNSGGTLRLESLGSLGSGNVTIAISGNNTGTLELALTGTNTITNTFSGFSSANALTGGGQAQILNTSGNNTITSALNIISSGGNGLNVVSNGGLLTLAGTINSNLTFRVLALGGSGNGIVSGQMTQTSGSVALNINKTGSGTWTFTNNSNNYNRRLQIFDGTIQVGNGGTTGILSSGQDVIFDPTATPAAKLVFNRSNSYSYGSATVEISGPGSVEQAGTGITTLSGNNTYTGTTTVTAGTLQFSTTLSLYNGTVSNWTPANIIVSSGATLGINVGGAAQFSSGNVTTLLTNLGGLGGAVSNNGLKAGSAVRFDTTNAGGNFTVADTLADSTGTGGGSIGLTKAGAGALTLAANNSYTGTTTVTAGTLVLSGTSTSPTFGVSSGATLTNNAPSELSAALALTEGALLAGTGNFATSNLTVTADLSGGSFTSINLATMLTKGGSASLAFSLTNVTDGTYAIFSGTSPTGFFSSVSVGGTSLVDQGGNIFSANIGGTTYTYDDNGFGSLVVAVPEPGTWILVGIGLTFLLYRKPRRTGV